MTELKINDATWIKYEVASKEIEQWNSTWSCDDGDGALVHINKDGSGFSLRCFSGIPASEIFIDILDFGVLWRKAKIFKAINKLSYVEQCLHICDYLCEQFCSTEDQQPRDMPESQLNNEWRNSLTVGDLKKHIEKNNLPDDGIVLVERIEDFYFKRNNWSVHRKKGEEYHRSIQWNEDIKSGKYSDPEKYPGLVGKELKEIDEATLNEMKTQYHSAFCCAKYKDDDKNLYINSHY